MFIDSESASNSHSLHTAAQTWVALSIATSHNHFSLYNNQSQQNILMQLQFQVWRNVRGNLIIVKAKWRRVIGSNTEEQKVSCEFGRFYLEVLNVNFLIRLMACVILNSQLSDNVSKLKWPTKKAKGAATTRRTSRHPRNCVRILRFRCETI